jgi:hypothetical protein
MAGAVAGLVAAWAMESFQIAWTNTTTHVVRQRVLVREGAGDRRGAKDEHEDPARMDPPPEGNGEEPSTVKVATAVAEPLIDRELTEDERQAAGEVVHYAFGGVNGAIYGALADVIPFVRVGTGTVFGMGVWLAADELMLWKLGISKKPTAYPGSTHLYAFASHLVYGFTLEAVRRAIRWMF